MVNVTKRFEVKHPKIVVQLSGQDGNAHFIIGTVVNAMRRAGVPDAEVQEFITEAKSGDYDNVIQTAMRWVDAR